MIKLKFILKSIHHLNQTMLRKKNIIKIIIIKKVHKNLKKSFSYKIKQKVKKITK